MPGSPIRLEMAIRFSAGTPDSQTALVTTIHSLASKQARQTQPEEAIRFLDFTQGYRTPSVPTPSSAIKLELSTLTATTTLTLAATQGSRTLPAITTLCSAIMRVT